MRLTAAQVQRLCGVQTAICALVLEDLVRAQFLHMGADGSYSRGNDGSPARSRMPRPQCGWEGRVTARSDTVRRHASDTRGRRRESSSHGRARRRSSPSLAPWRTSLVQHACTFGSTRRSRSRSLTVSSKRGRPSWPSGDSTTFESIPFSSSMYINPTITPRTRSPPGKGGPSTKASNGSPSYDTVCGTNP